MWPGPPGDASTRFECAHGSIRSRVPESSVAFHVFANRYFREGIQAELFALAESPQGLELLIAKNGNHAVQEHASNEGCDAGK
jgi:hypothetical protein